MNQNENIEHAENIRRNVRHALSIINERENEELHDILLHIDTIAQQIQSNR